MTRPGLVAALLIGVTLAGCAAPAEKPPPLEQAPGVQLVPAPLEGCRTTRFLDYHRIAPSAVSDLVPRPFQVAPDSRTGMAVVGVAVYECDRGIFPQEEGPIRWARTSIDVTTEDPAFAPAEDNGRVSFVVEHWTQADGWRRAFGVLGVRDFRPTDRIQADVADADASLVVEAGEVRLAATLAAGTQMPEAAFRTASFRAWFPAEGGFAYFEGFARGSILAGPGRFEAEGDSIARRVLGASDLGEVVASSDQRFEDGRMGFVPWTERPGTAESR